MTQLRTQLIFLDDSFWADTDGLSQYWVTIALQGSGNQLRRKEYNHSTGAEVSSEDAPFNGGICSFSNGDTIDFATGIYTFANGQPNRFQTPTLSDNPFPQERDANISSNEVGFDDLGNAFEYSKLTKVVGTGGLTVTTSAENPGVVTIDGSGVTPDFNDTALTGNTTAENLSVSGTTSVAGLSSSGDVSLGAGLSVTGSSSLGATTVSTLTASGATTLEGVTVNGALNIARKDLKAETGVYASMSAVPQDEKFTGNSVFVRPA